MSVSICVFRIEFRVMFSGLVPKTLFSRPGAVAGSGWCAPFRVSRIRISDYMACPASSGYQDCADWEDLKTPIWLISEPECVPVFQSREWDAVSGTLYLVISV